MYLTYQDAVDHTFRYLGGGPSDVVLADIRLAVDSAYRELYGAHNWTYYYKHGRINTVSPYTTGTIDCVASTRTVTLSGGTWPSWAEAAYIRVGTSIHRVLSVTDPATLVLDPTLCPVADIVAGTPYTIYKDSYILPDDFLATDQGSYENSFGGLTYTHPREWLFTQRYIYQSGMPQAFTITGEERYPGKLLLRIFPIPTDAKTIDFIYKRAPRSLKYSSVTSGTVSLSGDALTFSASVLNADMVGSVIRISSNTKTPTAGVGLNPPAFEAKIRSVASSTTATLDTSSGTAYSGAAYIISDPIDIEQQSMSTALLRCCEMMIGMGRVLKDKPDTRVQYLAALAQAKDRDSRSFSRRFVGDNWVHRQRAKDMPLDLYPTYK